MKTLVDLIETKDAPHLEKFIEVAGYVERNIIGNAIEWKKNGKSLFLITTAHVVTVTTTEERR